MSKSKTFCAFGSSGKLYEALYEVPHIAKEFIQRNTKGRVILSSDYNTKITKSKNLEFRYLNLESDATTTIFENKVAIHTVNKKSNVILITNESIAKSFQNHFEVLWNSAKNI